MEIGASLVALDLFASNPQATAAFYAKTFCLAITPAAAPAGALLCQAPGRTLRLLAGPAGQLLRASYRFHSQAAFQAHQAWLADNGCAVLQEEAGACAVTDPAGHLVRFLPPGEGGTAAPGSANSAAQRSTTANSVEDTAAGAALAARLQHFALRHPQPAVLVDFYVNQLGFVLSDQVRDEAGDLTAAFLRTDAEHHALAIFRAPVARFDHFSCETGDWLQLRDWADHMASTGTDLAWGVGRHGPGNDTFLMVCDPDGNMGEISAELELCAPGRPAGLWPHRPQTLNRWGVAIMRS